MSKLNIFITALFVAVLASCKSVPDGDKAKTGDAKEVLQNTSATELTIDTSHSKLEWVGTKVSQHHSGTVAIKSGKLAVAGDELKGGSFIIDMPTLIATNLDEKSNSHLTDHLKSPDFFDVEKFPEAKFEITDVKPFSGNIADENTTLTEDINEYRVTNPNVMISGNLTIKDVTKNIEFPAMVEINNSKVSAMAKFMIDRKLWGITYPGMPDDLIKDDLWFGVSVVAPR